MAIIVQARPPNYDEIAAVLPLRAGVIFSHAPYIFNPDGIVVTPALQAHEAVHLERQGDDPKAWWERYLKSPAFRLEEEIPAHVMEYRRFCCQRKDRNIRARYMVALAACLSSPLYGGLLDQAKALTVLRGLA